MKTKTQQTARRRRSIGAAKDISVNKLLLFLTYLAAMALGATAYHCLCLHPDISPEDPEQVVIRNLLTEVLPDKLPPTPDQSFRPAT